MAGRYLVNNETKQKLEYPVKMHIITRNFWEHYVFETPDIGLKDDRQFALVMGDETELGYISYKELKPHVISAVLLNDKSTDDIFPPEGYSWAK